MPNRITIYVRDELLRACKTLDMNVSQVCQTALEAAYYARIGELRDTVAAAENARRILEQIDGDGSDEVEYEFGDPPELVDEVA